MKKIFLIILSFLAISSMSLAFGLNSSMNYQGNVAATTNTGYATTGSVGGSTSTGHDDNTNGEDNTNINSPNDNYQIPENCQV